MIEFLKNINTNFLESNLQFEKCSIEKLSSFIKNVNNKENIYKKVNLFIHNSINNYNISNKFFKIFKLIRCMEDSDEFYNYYSHYLCKRLFYNTNIDLEKHIFSFFNDLDHLNFQYKILNIFNDIKTSNELNNDYNKNYNKNFNCLVTTLNMWNIPPKYTNYTYENKTLKNYFNDFKKFYNTKFDGRKLTLVEHLSYAEINFKQYTFLMDVIQINFILLFNNKSKLQKNKIKINNAIKYILNKNLIIEESEYYVLNNNFSSQKKIINFRDYNKENTKKVEEKVTYDKKLLIDSYIVKIMKNDKKLAYDKLFEKLCLKINKFKVEEELFKKSLDNLIDKDYLELENSEYIYVP